MSDIDVNIDEKTKLLRTDRFRFSISSLIIHILLILFASMFILPLIMPMLFVFKTPLEFAYDPWGLPKKLLADNFIEAWRVLNILQSLSNSLIVCFGTIIITVPASAMAGYVFSRFRNKITDLLFYVVMAGFFIPVQMVLIPLTKITLILHINNTLPGLFLPLATFGIPFWTMIFRSFFSNLPGELMEAAKIDGAGNWRIFLQIMAPLSRPAIVLASLLTFFGAWNDFLLSLILISKQELYTIQLRVYQLTGTFGANYFPQFSAGLVIAAVPTLVLYIILRKKIIEGTTLSGAIKG
jgi:raffinose/stachyose/melibiose transport system permease protein